MTIRTIGAIHAGVVAASAMLAACHAPPLAPPPAAPPAPALPTTTSAPAARGIPDTPAGHQLAWLLDVLARQSAAERSEIEAHFSPGLLAELPPERAVAALSQLAHHTAGMTVSGVTAADPEHVVLHAVAAGTRFALVVDLDPASHRIARLDVTADAGPRPRSIDDAIAQLRAQSPDSQLLVAELHDGACAPLHAWNADAELAIASQFKLYVLLAVADRIRDGRARWDDELAVRADWRSLPGGITQDEPVGARLSLRTLAERMIAISDNTAADYLLYFVGRERVEAALAAAHHAHPERNTPFLSTRELFWFKLMMSRAEIGDYLQLPGAQRRSFLDGLAGKLPVNDHDFWSEPREIDRIEWFATAHDLCRVMATLQARAQHPAAAPLLAVLGKNPGLEHPGEHPWTYAGFKGGSEPGVVGATWLLERDDHRWFVVHIGANARHPLDEGTAIGIANGVIDLLGAAR